MMGPRHQNQQEKEGLLYRLEVRDNSPEVA